MITTSLAHPAIGIMSEEAKDPHGDVNLKEGYLEKQSRYADSISLSQEHSSLREALVTQALEVMAKKVLRVDSSLKHKDCTVEVL